VVVRRPDPDGVTVRRRRDDRASGDPDRGCLPPHRTHPSTTRRCGCTNRPPGLRSAHN